MLTFYTYFQTFTIAYIFRDFTKALITFPKPVIAVVNGPAVGLGMAMLPLCDIVYASDKATFYLPYSALSQTPEGCASYTLPQSVGMAMVSDNRKGCLCLCGFVSKKSKRFAPPNQVYNGSWMEGVS